MKMSLHKKKSTWREITASRIRKNPGKVWKVIAERITSPRQNLGEVNISRINRATKANEVVVVPGKVLGYGSIDHKVVIGAISFSKSAKEKIENAKGECLTLEELAKKYPDGKNVRILG